MTYTYDVVIPTVGRASLGRLLRALADQPDPLPERIWLVDDRPAPSTASLRPHEVRKGAVIEVLRSGGRGPAAARNVGWRASSADWIAFLDDDVVPPGAWTRALAADLDAAGDLAGVQGRIVVPLPTDRRPTDWERNVKGLEQARWATADMAYRRAALQQVGGFDERFRRNYREDADLGLRIVDAGWTIARGRRTVVHPVGGAGPWISLRAQAGNADDALMRAIHGPSWRIHAGAPKGRLRHHALTAGAALLSLAAQGAGARRTAKAAGAVWAAATIELAAHRIVPGPKTPREIATMVATSALMPFAATGQWLRGELRARRAAGAKPAAVLLDRDDTLIVDVPYNGDPAKVEPMPGAREALQKLRHAGIPTAVISNQSGIGRGLLTEAQVHAVNAQVDALLGPLDAWLFCPHAPEERCDCRKPAPGLVHRAAERLGVAPERCVVIGDIGADVEAARAAGAQAVLVPTPRTRPDEVAAASLVAPDLPTAIRMVLA